MKPIGRLIATFLLATLAGTAFPQYAGWQHSGSLYVLTTPEGAVEKDFPLLVRLHKDFFNFSQTKAEGADVRFSTAAGASLAFQIEDWDAAKGAASIWVRVPIIRATSIRKFACIGARRTRPASQVAQDRKSVV